MKNTIHQSTTWIYLSAILLPFNGGYLSAATLVSFLHNAVGYVTGNIALSGTFFAYAEYALFFKMLALVLSFLLGAFISGLMVKSENYHKDYRYGLTLVLQLLLVLISMFLILHNIHFCEYLLAATLGLQNAMTSHYGTALIRTTHMTGTTTDLGVLLAHWVKGKAIQVWKIKLYFILILFFLLGSIAGAIAFKNLNGLSFITSIIIYSIMILIHKF